MKSQRIKIQNYFKKRELVGYSLFLFTIGASLKGFSLVKEIIIANYYGTSLFKDGFVALIALFSIFFGPLIEAMIASVPKFIKEKENTNFSLFLLLITVTFSTIISIVLYLYSPFLISLIYGNLAKTSVEVINNYLIYGLIFVNIHLWIQLLSQFFYAKNAYWNAEYKSVVISLSVICFIGFKWTFFNVDPLVMGHVFGVALVLVMMITQLSRHGIMKVANIQYITTSMVKNWLKWSMNHFFPLIFIFSLSIVTLFIIQSVMSSYGPAILSANDYAFRLYLLAILILFMPIVTPLFTLISTADATIEMALQRFNRVLKFIGLLFAATFLPTYFFADWLIKIIFERGAFNEFSTKITALLLVYYMAGIFFDVIRKILLRILLVFEKTKFLIISSIASNAMFVGLVIIGNNYLKSFLIIPIGIIIVNVSFGLIEYLYLKRLTN